MKISVIICGLIRPCSFAHLQNTRVCWLKARRMELAIPGTYEPWRSLGTRSGQPSVIRVLRIMCIRPTLTVITSKQRPRKLTMVGSDGREYSFLLKGHEDLRQDERVMQLLGLVNCFLLEKRAAVYSPRTTGSAGSSLAAIARYNRSNISNLTIPRMSVIPLSTNSGLLGA